MYERSKSERNILGCSLVRYINSQFNKVLTNYISTSAFLPLVNNENNFSVLRCQLLDTPTILEFQIASRMTKTTDVKSKMKANDSLAKV